MKEITCSCTCLWCSEGINQNHSMCNWNCVSPKGEANIGKAVHTYSYNQGKKEGAKELVSKIRGEFMNRVEPFDKEEIDNLLAEVLNEYLK